MIASKSSVDMSLINLPNSWRPTPKVPKAVVAPINLLTPTSLMAASLLPNSFKDTSNVLKPVLNISAGKAIKSPKGKPRRPVIASGTSS